MNQSNIHHCELVTNQGSLGYLVKHESSAQCHHQTIVIFICLLEWTVGTNFSDF